MRYSKSINYYKKPKKGSLAYEILQKRKSMEYKTPVIEPKDNMVGVAKVTKESTMDLEEQSKSLKYKQIHSEYVVMPKSRKSFNSWFALDKEKEAKEHTIKTGGNFTKQIKCAE